MLSFCAAYFLLTLPSQVDIDLTFVRAKEKTAKTLTFPDFLKALAEIATRSGVTVEDIHNKVINSAVSSSGTKADNVKLHDDKNLYTGVHGKGGPSTNDSRITLSNLADRTGTDARGVKLNPK